MWLAALTDRYDTPIHLPCMRLAVKGSGGARVGGALASTLASISLDCSLSYGTFCRRALTVRDKNTNDAINRCTSFRQKADSW